ncbi:MAG: hypothetical protein K9M99_05485 [Candidatus Cloacimonetes bacterium]|nr:hypothetical protein [Candidatus Cloacimonadota bacterium]
MKNLLKIMLIALVTLFIFACESDDLTKDTADIQISNLSNNPANVYIHNSGSNSYLQDTIPANGSKVVTIEDGEAGLNVNGGRAIIDYRHVINTEEVDQVSFVYADLNPATAAFVQIDNQYGCLDIESYSQSADMWVNIDYGPSEIIPAWGDLTKFYDPTGLTQNVYVQYNGYTFFEGATLETVIEDGYTRLDLSPNAGCIWVNNNSLSYYITQVYMTPSSQSTWGDDVLPSTIGPDEFFAWSVTPNILWDLKVVDNYGDEFPFTGLNVQTDDVYIYNYTGFREAKSLTADQDKIDNAKNYESTVSNPRCEANNFPIIPVN